MGGHPLQGVQLHVGLMDVNGLADGPGVLGRLVAGPGSPGDDLVPAVLTAQVQQRVKADHRLGGGGAVHSPGQLRHALGAHEGEHPLAVQGVDHRLLQPQLVGAPGVDGDHRRLQGELELDLLAHGSEEAVLHPLMLQQLQGPLGGGELLMAVHLLGHAAHLQPVGTLLAGRAAELLGQAAGHLGQALQQEGVESPALAIQDHLHRRLVGKCLFIDPLAGQRVVDVRQGHHLGADGDLVPLQPVGVAAPVVPLVVPAADGPGHLYQGLVVMDGQIVHHLRAHHRVGLHDLEFLVGQAARLVEHLAGDGDLADIVEGGGGADQGHIPPGELVAVCFQGEMAQEELRQGPDM